MAAPVVMSFMFDAGSILVSGFLDAIVSPPTFTARMENCDPLRISFCETSPTYSWVLFCLLPPSLTAGVWAEARFPPEAIARLSGLVLWFACAGARPPEAIASTAAALANNELIRPITHKFSIFAPIK